MIISVPPSLTGSDLKLDEPVKQASFFRAGLIAKKCR
jgi:hypothetical protein